MANELTKEQAYKWLDKIIDVNEKACELAKENVDKENGLYCLDLSGVEHKKIFIQSETFKKIARVLDETYSFKALKEPQDNFIGYLNMEYKGCRIYCCAYEEDFIDA